MRKHHRGHREIPERAAACLTCACEDQRNVAARKLLRRTAALSATGVVAAILVADSSEHIEIVELARTAIDRQRGICRDQGPFESNRCGEQGLAALRRK